MVRTFSVTFFIFGGLAMLAAEAAGNVSAT